MDTKKISFGFSKSIKKSVILPAKPVKEASKVELIKCLEGKEIKLVVEKQDVAPLVIQMVNNQKTSTALASLKKRRAVLLDEDDPGETDEEPKSITDLTTGVNGENLEQRAARELIAAAKANDNNDVDGEKLVLPALKADELPLDGAKESTIDDYESIPIRDFGLAMLRGMGWVDPPPKKKGSAPADEAPFLRPKGMGLGADKALKSKPLLVQPESNEVLEIKKQAYVRILGGKQKDQYGQIEGFDDHAGRVIVKMAIGGNKEAFNEFLCQPVSKKEFAQYGKCINSAKYDEYKKQENEHGQIIIKKERCNERAERRDRNEIYDERRSDKDHKDQRKVLKEEDRKMFKKEERKPFRDEERKNYKDDEQKQKPYKTEKFKSFHDEDRKPYKTEDHKSYKNEDKSSIKNNHGREFRDGQNASSSRSNERGHDSRSSITCKSSTRYQEERERSSREGQRSCSRSSKNCRTQNSSSDEAEDTGESTESDSDSAYERKHKKKSSNNKSKKKKSKKPKGKLHRPQRTDSSNSESSYDETARHKNKHKKKTKKSKHARSRSRERDGRGR